MRPLYRRVNWSTGNGMCTTYSQKFRANLGLGPTHDSPPVRMLASVVCHGSRKGQSSYISYHIAWSHRNEVIAIIRGTDSDAVSAAERLNDLKKLPPCGARKQDQQLIHCQRTFSVECREKLFSKRDGAVWAFRFCAMIPFHDDLREVARRHIRYIGKCNACAFMMFVSGIDQSIDRE